MSAALASPETCMAGLDGTNGNMVKDLVSPALTQVTSNVQHLLTQVRSSYDPNGHPPENTGGQQYPSWMKARDKKMVEEDDEEVVADAVVAADGSGDFTSVGDAVEAAPDYSMRRFVIYVKKGVYVESVMVKRHKWNIMMIGDGINVTVITNNRSYVDGWTTFRTATFGNNYLIN